MPQLTSGWFKAQLVGLILVSIRIGFESVVSRYQLNGLGARRGMSASTNSQMGEGGTGYEIRDTGRDGYAHLNCEWKHWTALTPANRGG